MAAKRRKPKWSPRKRLWALLAAIAAFAVLAVTSIALIPAKVPNLNDGTRIAAGAVLYAKHCASCHGANLEGQPDWRVPLANGRLPAPPHDDSGHTWHHRPDVLFIVIRGGMNPPVAPSGYQSDMPAFAGALTDDEIWDVLAFVRSRWSEQTRTKNDRIAAKAVRAAGQ